MLRLFHDVGSGGLLSCRSRLSCSSSPTLWDRLLRLHLRGRLSGVFSTDDFGGGNDGNNVLIDVRSSTSASYEGRHIRGASSIPAK